MRKGQVEYYVQITRPRRPSFIVNFERLTEITGKDNAEIIYDRVMDGEVVRGMYADYVFEPYVPEVW